MAIFQNLLPFKITIVKQTYYLLVLLCLLTACNRNVQTANGLQADSVNLVPETLHPKTEDTGAEMVVDEPTLYEDSSFRDLNLKWVQLSKDDFQSYKTQYQTQCVLDSGNFISGSGLYVKHNPNKIGQTFFVEKATSRKILIPSSYDAGILKMLLSPTCNQLIVCSSYDGPDYASYYTHRSEIFVFKVTNGVGLKGIKPAFKYFSKDWSIEDLTWVNDKTIGLKIYEGDKSNEKADGSGIHYKYVKADL